jgi:hypothetical protein
MSNEVNSLERKDGENTRINKVNQSKLNTALLKEL